MIELKAKTEEAAKVEAVSISKEKPDKYVTVAAVFGLFAVVSDRLHINSPSDTCFSWYVLNGEVKRFTEAQKVADQNATPNMY